MDSLSTDIKTENMEAAPAVKEEISKVEDSKKDISKVEDIKKEISEMEDIKEDIKKDISELERKIIAQIEYYFGDYNLFMDKFLRQQIQENDGWIDMDTMVKFNRLKKLSGDFVVIATALKKSPSKLMEVNEDGTKIRRSPDRPLPEKLEDLRQQLDSRTVYVKGFNQEATLDQLLEFFQQYIAPQNVFMRRKIKKFKGSVFATFFTKEDTENFLKIADFKYKGKELIREMKVDYVKRKDEFFKELREKKEKKRQAAQEDSKNGVVKVEKMEESEEPMQEEITKGCIMKLSGLSEETMWEHIKEVLKPHGEIAYVDYSKGKPVAFVRFETGVAAEVLNAAGTEVDGAKVVKINDNDAVAVVLEGDEEVEYWKSIATLRRQRNAERGNWRGRGHGRRGGKPHHFNKKMKRKQQFDGRGARDGPSAKVIKTE